MLKAWFDASPILIRFMSEKAMSSASPEEAKLILALEHTVALNDPAVQKLYEVGLPEFYKATMKPLACDNYVHRVADPMKKFSEQCDKVSVAVPAVLAIEWGGTERVKPEDENN